MKKKLPFHLYDFLRRELQELEQKGQLLPNQATSLLDNYESVGLVTAEKRKMPFFQLLSIIGAVLIGLGFLSFVASNWSGWSDMTKFSILLFALIFTYVIARLLEEKKPALSKSLYYIGVFAYGAEIFYIGQLFHLGGSVENAFLAWALGALPLAYYLNDRKLYYFSFALIYLSIEMKYMLIDGPPSQWMLVILPALFAVGYYVFKKFSILIIVNFLLLYQFIVTSYVFYPFAEKQFPLVLTLLLPLLFYVGHRVMNRSVPLFVGNVLLVFQWLILTLYYFEADKVVYFVLPIFLIGLFMAHRPFITYKDVMKRMGVLVHFFTGVMLTFSWVWEEYTNLYSTADTFLFPFWLLFGIAYMVYGFFLAYKGELVGVIIVSFLIFRFYVDVSLVFMDKSIAFFIGGILLLVLGYWFEKTRRGEKRFD